jgi:hypothetical protein
MAAHRGASLIILLSLAACGDDSNTAVRDAATSDGNDHDAMTDIDAAVPATCDYTEAADGTNGTVTGAETTNLTLATKLTLCAQIDNGHFSQQVVDTDAFKFTIAADTDVIMHITGAGIDALADTLIQLRRGNAFVAFGVVEGDHGTLIAHLPAGEYVAAMAAFNGSDLAAPVPYRLTIATDAPATRCAALTGAATYTEANDGASHNGNDVINYNSTSNTPSTLTASTVDAPEPTNITVASGMRYLIAGSSADVNPPDDYEDRDTFAFTTGPTTTQMTVRLNWPATTVDLDYRVYPPSTTAPLSIVGGLKASQSEYELETFAVKPNTTYWLWIAAEDGSTGQPAAYAATLCGETFTP